MGEIECTKCLYNINSKCEIGGWNIPKVGCPDGKAKPMTNADRIRSMTDEEMAVLLSNTEANFPPNCQNGVSVKLCETAWLDWLRQEATE